MGTLEVRIVEVGSQRLRQAVVAEVADDAHDGDPRTGVAERPELDPLPDRVLPGELLPRQGLVDDAHQVETVPVRCGESAARDDRNPERLEITRRHRLVMHDQLLALGRLGAALDRHAGLDIPAAERDALRRAGHFDAGERPEALQELRVEQRPRRRLAVLRFREAQAEGQHPARIESEGGPRQRAGALEQGPPPPTATTGDGATAPPTRLLRTRPRRRPSPDPPVPSRSALARLKSVFRNAGTSPKRTPVSAASPAVMATVVASRRRGMYHGRPPGTRSPNNRTPAAASATPSRPPAPASTRLSVSSWRTRRPRPAPIATRTPISRWRAAPRVSIRLATLAQTISSRNPTPPRKTSSGLRMSPTRSWRREIASASQPVLSRGKACCSRREIRSRSRCACSSVTPGRRRPMAPAYPRLPWPSIAPSTVKGTQAWPRVGNANPRGMIPITRVGSPFTAMVRPTTERSPPNRRCQRPYPSITTWSRPRCSSSGRKARPRNGEIPSRGKRFALTSAPSTRSGSPSPVNVSAFQVYMPSCAKLRLSFHQET